MVDRISGSSGSIEVGQYHEPLYSDDLLRNKPEIEEFADAIGIFVRRLNVEHGIKIDSEVMATLAGNFQIFLIENGFFITNSRE